MIYYVTDSATFSPSAKGFAPGSFITFFGQGFNGLGQASSAGNEVAHLLGKTAVFFTSPDGSIFDNLRLVYVDYGQITPSCPMCQMERILCISM